MIKKITTDLLQYEGDLAEPTKKQAHDLAYAINAGKPVEAPKTAEETFVHKVARDAYKVLDSDFDLLKQDLGEEQIYELLIATTVGSASGRIESAQQCLESCDG